MNLSNKEYKQLEIIQNKIINNEATNNDLKDFLNLILKSGNENEMLDYMKTIGFNSIDEVRDELNSNKKSKNNNDNLVTGLAIAGGAILLAFLLSK